MRARLPTALLALLALLGLAGCGGGTPARVVPRPAPGGIVTVQDRPEPAPTAAAHPTASLPALAPPVVPGAWRARELRRLRATTSVRGALRRAWLAHAVTRTQYAADRALWTRARAVARRLPPSRAAELRAVVAQLRGLAAARELTTSRLPAALLTLHRNLAFWPREAFPRAGERFQAGRDPVVFRYEPGQGLQIHWLGTWGRENARAHACLRAPSRCPRRALAAELDRLTPLAALRHGYRAYEEDYRFGGSGSAPWVSGMVQGTAIQALARARAVLGAPRFGLAARRALGAFEQPPPTGVAVPAPGGAHFLMYSFAPGLRILNGDLQAVTGLHDLAAITRSRRARRLYRRGERAARLAVPAFDTGAWSLYSQGGRESTLPYHRLVDGFLRNLCTRTHRSAYCRTAARFARYEREPPRIDLPRVRRRLRTGRAAPVAFALSKLATVSVEVRDGRRVVLLRSFSVPRGRHVVPWTPVVPGRYTVTVRATGPSGPTGAARRTERVVRPRHRARHRRRRPAHARPPSVQSAPRGVSHPSGGHPFRHEQRRSTTR